MASTSDRPVISTVVNPIEAWEQGTNNIRILLVISSPIDEPERLDSTREIQEMYQQLSWAKVPAALIRLNPPTWRFLQTTLHARRFDIVHFIGHARKNEIQMEKEDGSADWISSENLAFLFRNTGVKLVVLNNCNTESIGDALVSANIPAVIATSRKLRSHIASLLSGSLYSALASHYSLEAAVERIERTLRQEGYENEKALVTALGPGADQVLLTTNLGPGNTEFFPCNPPNNLPPHSRERFFDRVSDVLHIHKLLVASSSPFIGVTGLAGTGKSTLAIGAAWQYSWRFPRGIAYASLRKMRPFNPISLLAHLEWGLDEIPSNKQQKVALYELGRGPILILIDDLEEATAEECKEIIDLLGSWDTSLGGRAMLIMRWQRPEFDNLVQSNWISVGEFPESTALDFLSHRLGGVEAARTRLGKNLLQVPQLCYCHPKLLTLTAAALQLGIPWRELSPQLKRLIGTPVAQMEQMLEITINRVQNESPIAGQFLDCWSVFAEAATEEAWRFVLSGKKVALDDQIRLFQNDALETLQRANILQRFEQQCRIHPLVSEYLKSHRWEKLSQEKRSEYQQRHLNFYCEEIASRGAEYPILSEWDNVLRALGNASNAQNWKGLLALCSVLVNRNTSPLFRKNLCSYAKQTLHFAIQAAQKLAEPKWQAIFLYDLGISQYRMAEYREAEASFAQSLKISQQIEDVELIFDTTLEIGRVYYRVARYELAREYFEDAQRFAESKGDQERIASVLQELGRLAYREKRISTAKQLLDKALHLRENLNDKLGIAQTLHELARVSHEMALQSQDRELFNEARRLYHRSLLLRREIADYIGQQATIHQLGLLEFDQEAYENARKYYDECIELSNALNDRFWIAHNHFRYARLLWRLNKRDEAINMAKQSLELCTVIGISLKTEVEVWLTSPF
ncbi:MAG TPA: tetratricopeptide repeat protein [Ktedonobacteraceae bacterium]|jgi:tetratricopeptide (TPR) repeat protein|nr:tetratricopeptide repeat protein [Ktedonobacteraceae bacterium]